MLVISTQDALTPDTYTEVKSQLSRRKHPEKRGHNLPVLATGEQRWGVLRHPKETPQELGLQFKSNHSRGEASDNTGECKHVRPLQQKSGLDHYMMGVRQNIWMVPPSKCYMVGLLGSCVPPPSLQYKIEILSLVGLLQPSRRGQQFYTNSSEEVLYEASVLTLEV